MEQKRILEEQMKSGVEYYVAKGFKIFFFVVLAIAFAFLVGYVMMLLWNWLMPELFGLPAISYWQAVGVLILAKIIFGFGSGGGPSRKRSRKSNHRFRSSGKCGPMRRDFSEWKRYDEFWKEEGEQAFRDFVNRKKEANEKADNDTA